MYGGLFGDLPAAKNSKEKPSGDDTSSGTTDRGSDNGGRASTNNPPVSSRTGTKKRRETTSVARNIGAIGTSMAFVPTATRNRKRNLAPSSSKTASVVNKSAVPKQAPSSFAVTLQTATTSTSLQNEESKQEDPKNDDDDELVEEEPDEMRRLHETVTDPYDPFVPNDLLQYWDRKALEQERQQLEREARETLENQERLRLKLEQERHELELAGNLDKLVEHRSQNPMGRGRGVSNLPAWLVERQKKESALGKPTF